MRPSVRLLIPLALAPLLVLAACGDQEATQRKDFIEFLQTRILNKKGSHVPEMSDNQKDAFGLYAKDYAIIYDFNRPPDGQGSLGQLKDIASRGNLKSLSDVISRHDDIAKSREAMNQLQSEMDKGLAKAEAAKAALKQPDDLKVVYDKVYDRDVTQVAARTKQVSLATEAVFEAALKVSDFAAANKDKLQINGMVVNAKDQSTLKALQPLLDDFNIKSRALVEAARPMMKDMADTQSGD